MNQRYRTYRTAALGVGAVCIAAFGVSRAQTVLGNSTPAECIQNAENRAFACGSGATASPGTGATAVGINAKANGDAAMAFGHAAHAGSIAAMAIGQESSATDQGGVAFGQGAGSTGFASVAFGFAARALANEAVSIGNNAITNGNFGTALGTNALAKFEGSAALGAGAETKAPNQMVLGTAKNIYVLPGANSATSAAALKGPVKMLVIDADGNIGVADLPTRP